MNNRFKIIGAALMGVLLFTGTASASVWDALSGCDTNELGTFMCGLSCPHGASTQYLSMPLVWAVNCTTYHSGSEHQNLVWGEKTPVHIGDKIYVMFPSACTNHSYTWSPFVLAQVGTNGNGSRYTNVCLAQLGAGYRGGVWTVPDIGAMQGPEAFLSCMTNYGLPFYTLMQDNGTNLVVAGPVRSTNTFVETLFTATECLWWKSKNPSTNFTDFPTQGTLGSTWGDGDGSGDGANPGSGTVFSTFPTHYLPDSSLEIIYGGGARGIGLQDDYEKMYEELERLSREYHKRYGDLPWGFAPFGNAPVTTELFDWDLDKDSSQLFWFGVVGNPGTYDVQCNPGTAWSGTNIYLILATNVPHANFTNYSDHIQYSTNGFHFVSNVNVGTNCYGDVTVFCSDMPVQLFRTMPTGTTNYLPFCAGYCRISCPANGKILVCDPFHAWGWVTNLIGDVADGAYVWKYENNGWVTYSCSTNWGWDPSVPYINPGEAFFYQPPEDSVLTFSGITRWGSFTNTFAPTNTLKAMGSVFPRGGYKHEVYLDDCGYSPELNDEVNLWSQPVQDWLTYKRGSSQWTIWENGQQIGSTSKIKISCGEGIFIKKATGSSNTKWIEQWRPW